MKKLSTKYIVAIIISLILGISILGYGYMDYKYKKEALEHKIKSETQAKRDKEQEEYQKNNDYNACVKQAEEKHSWNWQRECENIGSIPVISNCRLPPDTAYKLEEIKNMRINNCYQKTYGK